MALTMSWTIICMGGTQLGAAGAWSSSGYLTVWQTEVVWNENGIEERLAAFEDERHVAAHGLGQQQDCRDKNCDLEPTVRGHG